MPTKKHISIKQLSSMIKVVDDDAFMIMFITWRKQQSKYLHKRHIRNLTRKLYKIKWKQGGKRKNYTKEEVLLLQNNFSMRENEILTGLFPKRGTNWIPTIKRKSTTAELDLRNFSFIDNPIDTIQAFADMAKAETSYAIRTYKVNFRDETIQDISPYLLFGAIKADMFPFISGGFMGQHLKQIMKPLKLDEYLQIQIWNDEESPNIIALPVLTKEHEDTEIKLEQAEARDIVATKICDQFDAWLKKLFEGKIKTLKLSDAGKKTLCGIISEVLENAEKHAEPEKGIGFGKWGATSFMEYDAQQNNYRCCISFFNKGQSIAETIQKTTDAKIKYDLDNYVKKHINRCDANNLATIFALQDLITREIKTASQGGYGMMNMVHFIQQIGKNEDSSKAPCIVIISGNTYIKFSDKYITTDYSATGERNQWFNDANSSDNPPDNNNVFALKNKIAGTIITARFYLDKEMIKDD